MFPVENAAIRLWRNRSATSPGNREFIAQVSDSLANLPDAPNAMYMTFGASGRLASDAGWSRSQLMVSMSQDCKRRGSCEEEKRETAMTRRGVAARSEALLAMRARVGPILPPAPRTRTSPGSRASARTVDSEGLLRRSSSSSTPAIGFSLCEITRVSRLQAFRGGIVLEWTKKH